MASINLGTFTLLTASLLLSNGAWGQSRPVTIACGAVGMEFEQCQTDVRAWEAATGHAVDIVQLPNASNERLDLYQELMSAESPDLDIYQLDVVWAGLLAHDLIDLAPYLDADSPAYFDSLIANNTVQNELIALPWFIDTGLLYYRADLLARHDRDVPTTWQELTETAAHIMAQEESGLSGDRLWGYVWQGDSYEGLTCNALEWFHSHTGSSFVEADLSVSINQPANVQALETAASWIGTISPKATLEFAEEESRAVFQRGDAVFMRNWPYAWNSAQQDESPIQGRIGMAPLPSGAGGSSSATLGGWQLGVSKHSRQQDRAVELLLFLTSEENQRNRALQSGYNPSIPALYEDPELLEAFPQFVDLVDIFQGGVARPATVTGRAYPLVSRIIQRNVHNALNDDATATEALQQMNMQLIRQSHWYGQQPLP